MVLPSRRCEIKALNMTEIEENSEITKGSQTEMREDMMEKCRKVKEKQAKRLAAEEKKNAAIAAADLDDLNNALKVCGLNNDLMRSAFITSQGLSSLRDFLFCVLGDGKEMVATHNCNATPETLVGYRVGTNLGALIFWV